MKASQEERAAFLLGALVGGFDGSDPARTTMLMSSLESVSRPLPSSFSHLKAVAERIRSKMSGAPDKGVKTG